VVFLVGVLPALFVLWVRREVPETEEWRAAKRQATDASPGIVDLFRGEVRRTTILTILVCSVSLSAHWAFIFWYQQHLRNLPDVINLSSTRKNELVSIANLLVMAASILGNFLAAVLALVIGYRRSIALLCLAYGLSLVSVYIVPRSHTTLGNPRKIIRS
jgi:predicted MFS family arabinose efflux permease